MSAGGRKVEGAEDGEDDDDDDDEHRGEAGGEAGEDWDKEGDEDDDNEPGSTAGAGAVAKAKPAKPAGGVKAEPLAPAARPKTAASSGTKCAADDLDEDEMEAVRKAQRAAKLAKQ